VFYRIYVKVPNSFLLTSRSLATVSFSPYRSGVAQRVCRGIALFFHYSGTRRGCVVSTTPRPHFPSRERPGTHFTGGWVGPRAGLDGRKISSPPGFDPRIVQPVFSRYTDWATGPTCGLKRRQNSLFALSKSRQIYEPGTSKIQVRRLAVESNCYVRFPDCLSCTQRRSVVTNVWMQFSPLIPGQGFGIYLWMFLCPLEKLR